MFGIGLIHLGILFLRIQEQYKEYGIIILFTAGFTPVPFKIFTISAGAVKISFPLFLMVTLISRSSRFFLVALLLWKFGGNVKVFIDRYFNLLSLLT